MFPYPMPRRKDGYMLWQGALRGYDRFGIFAEMPDWSKVLAERIEDLGPGDFTNFQLRQFRST